MTKVIIVSGGFDPVHIGHIRMFESAANMADTRAQVNRGKVIVALNSDDWLARKKGKIFMPFEERKEILLAMEAVTQVIDFDDNDETACDAIRKVHEKHAHLTDSQFLDDGIYFANGGDRIAGNVPTAESALCEELGVKMLWGLGGEKVQSSSTLTLNYNAPIELVPINLEDGEADESTADSDDKS